MRRIFDEDINTPEYWDTHQSKFIFGLREKKYVKLSAGMGQRIVDLGCGLSHFIALVPNFTERYGVDFSPKTIETAQKKYPHVKYILADCRRTPLENKSFDVSVAGEVIEHLPEPERLLEEMVRITKKRIIISTPHMEYDDKEHLWEFDEGDLIKMFSRHGKTRCETINADLAPGRSYIFAICDLL